VRLIWLAIAAVMLTTPIRSLQTGASRTALAIVSDAKNRLIVDVGPDDFVIQEAGKAREVLSVRIADYPVVVMLDTGADARTDFGLMRKAVERFIDRLGVRPVAIGTLGDPPTMLTTFDDERPKLTETLAALDFSSSSRSMLLQGTAVAADAIRATGTLFSAVVVLSATPSDSSRNSPDEMVASIVDSRAVLHVIANRSTQIVGQMGQIRSGTALRSIAEQTRGQYTVIYSPASYQPALDRLSDRMTSEMMVEYLVPPGSKPTDVKVGVRLAGAKVRGLGVAPR
jgi:microsomal dipeptidase-like Zn-dependent dipeptidase